MSFFVTYLSVGSIFLIISTFIGLKNLGVGYVIKSGDLIVGMKLPGKCLSDSIFDIIVKVVFFPLTIVGILLNLMETEESIDKLKRDSLNMGYSFELLNGNDVIKRNIVMSITQEVKDIYTSILINYIIKRPRT